MKKLLTKKQINKNNRLCQKSSIAETAMNFPVLLKEKLNQEAIPANGILGAIEGTMEQLIIM